MPGTSLKLITRFSGRRHVWPPKKISDSSQHIYGFRFKTYTSLKTVRGALGITSLESYGSQHSGAASTRANATEARFCPERARQDSQWQKWRIGWFAQLAMRPEVNTFNQTHPSTEPSMLNIQKRKFKWKVWMQRSIPDGSRWLKGWWCVVSKAFVGLLACRKSSFFN